ncbi:hypothetical protein HZC53_01065 [Candidatus Uhrbacteria bacterium]|nr:hypothetical protein [Candidatus Uhrbacteria bacterium]
MDVMVLTAVVASLVVNVVLVYLLISAKLRNRKPPEDDVSLALPPRSRLSLKERMADLGMGFHHYPGIEYISEDIRHLFIKAQSGVALCRRCQNSVDQVQSRNPAINPCNLGYFCNDCGEGRLFESVKRVREANGLPSLPDSNLFSILDVLERFALKNGLLHEPAIEQPQSVMFDAVLQETAGYRNPPLKARVDVEAQTVTLVDETVQSKSLRLVK